MIDMTKISEYTEFTASNGYRKIASKYLPRGFQLLTMLDGLEGAA